MLCSSMKKQARFLFCWLCLQVVFASVFSEEWEADVVSTIKALVTSCVVVPCTFRYPGTQLPDSRMRGIWHLKGNQKQKIFHEDETEIEDNFKGRTKLLGSLGNKNCTLEIDDIKNHDNGPFCFRVEIPQDSKNKFSFVEECVTITMMPNPDNPTLEQKEVLEDGVPATFKCFVRHTCPSHPPTITWSRDNKDATMKNRDLSNGVWEMESLLTLTPTEQDDHTHLNCTATFHGNKKSVTSNRLYVKRKANIFHIIIPVVAVIGTGILFGGVCFVMTKKYKRQIQELQTRGSVGMRSRLSRVSHRSYRGNEPRVHMTAKRNNHVSSVSENAGFSKPRFPSPKSEHKNYNKSVDVCSADYDEDDYTNVGEMSIYGNV